MFRTQYSAHHEFHDVFVSESFRAVLDSLLCEHVNETNGFSHKDLALRLTCGDTHHAEYGRTIFFDELHGLTLVFRDEDAAAPPRPIAYASFAVRGPRPGLLMPPYHLCIHQLQGMRIQKVSYEQELRRAFARIRWEALLVRTVIELARAVRGLSTVRLRRACCNEYYVPCAEGILAARNTRLEQRYDVTATQLGFSLSELYHVLPLT